MGHRTGVFGELSCAQHPHVLNALHRTRGRVGGEFLVAEHRQTFLQAELEPITARDAIARPVVEVLVRDDRLNTLVIVVGRRARIGQHELRVEDVQALVLHRAHVERVDGDDHVDVEVVLEPEALLVPAHRHLERAHRVFGAARVLVFDVDVQRDLAARRSRETLGVFVQVAGDERKQVRGLRERVFPTRLVAAAFELARRDAVTVRQQHGITSRIRLDRHAEARHHVGAIQVIRDAPKTLGFALRDEHTAGLVEPLERRVVLRLDHHLRLEAEGVGHFVDREASLVDRVRGEAELAPVDRDALELHLLAIQHERRAGIVGLGIAPHLQRRDYACVLLAQIEAQIDVVDQERRHAIVLAVLDARVGGDRGHGRFPSANRRAHRTEGTPQRGAVPMPASTRCRNASTSATAA